MLSNINIFLVATVAISLTNAQTLIQGWPAGYLHPISYGVGIPFRAPLARSANFVGKQMTGNEVDEDLEAVEVGTGEEEKVTFSRWVCYLNGYLQEGASRYCFSLVKNKDDVVFLNKELYSEKANEWSGVTFCNKVGFKEHSCWSLLVTPGREQDESTPFGALGKATSRPPPGQRLCQPRQLFKWARVRGVTRCVKRKDRFF